MKIVILAVALFLPLLANCQIEKPIKKGNVILGGNGNISRNQIQFNDVKTKLFSIDLNPAFSYFLVDNLAAGLTVLTGYSKQNGDNSFRYGIGPNIKYYFNSGFASQG